MEKVNSLQAFKSVFNVIKATFVIVPIVAGIDKFTNLLVDWKQYIHPGAAEMLPISGDVFMMIVGVIEIAAGLIVLKNARVGGMIVAAWLTVIALNLIASGNYLDVAVRDLVMAISAFSMSKMAGIFSINK